MGRVHFGLVVPAEFADGHDLPSFVSSVSRALRFVEGKFESAWVVDHLQSGSDQRLEAFTLLTYLAALHPTFQFGHTVLCQSFRNPALVAKMGATLQILTGGRFVLGLGAGGNEDEYRAYGYDFPPARTRVEELAESITIIKALWTQPVVTFQGKHHRVHAAQCEPRPHPVPPLMVGAFRPQMLRLVAREADWWNVSSTGPGKYARLASELERACDEVGRDPATVRRTWVGGFACAESTTAARELADARFGSPDDDDEFDLVGTPDEVAAQLQHLVDLGVDYFMLDAADFPRLEGLELLTTHVLPAIT